MRKRSLLILSLSLALAGCSQHPFTKPSSDDEEVSNPGSQSDKGQEGGSGNQQNPQQPSQPSEPEGPTFQIVKSQVFEGTCIRCHSVAGGNKGGINLETYRQVKQNLSAIEDSIVMGFMPPRGSLPDEKKELLFKWIDLGAPE